MPEIPIEFVSEEIDFKLSDEKKVGQWIFEIIKAHDFELENLTFIFCSDEYLHQINLDYLNHDTYTDIITFNNADIPGIIESDIFISTPRVEENAQSLGVNFNDELHRVMIHGLLHLIGFDDKDDVLKGQMRDKEDSCLSLRNF